MISAIVATHGNLGAELIATAKEVYSDVSNCYAVSNARMSPQALREELEAIVAGGGPDDRYVLFVDFFGGSCCHACMAVEMERKDVKLITGVNLPMLLAFLYKRKELSFEDLIPELLVRGQESIQLVSAKDD
jgi:mannose/fructose-specific phosphotransferase system component IIA